MRGKFKAKTETYLFTASRRSAPFLKKRGDPGASDHTKTMNLLASGLLSPNPEKRVSLMAIPFL
jgi:hypothetical protein